MKWTPTSKGYLGLLVGVAAGAYALASGAPSPPAAAPSAAPPQGGAAAPQKEPAPPPFKPTDRIDVERAVDFPYDI